MPDIVVPSGGTTDDQTPEVRIMLNGPLWPGSEVRVRRNGVDVGAATQLSPTEFSFVDNVTDGSFEYRAVVTRQGVNKQSAPYFVQVSTPVNGNPVPLIVSVNNDDMDLVIPTPVITGIIGEPIPVPADAQAGSLLVQGTESAVTLGSVVHWRRVVLSQPVAELKIDTAQGEADTAIALFSATGVLIATDDDGGGNLPGGSPYSSAIEVATLPAGTYYLAITGYGAAFAGAFSIIREDPPTDYVEDFILRMSYINGGA